MKISEKELVLLREKVSKIIVEHIEAAVPEDETIVFTVSGGMDSTFLYLTYLEYGNRPCEAVAFYLEPPYVSETFEHENLMKIDHLIQHKLYLEDIISWEEIPDEYRSLPNPFLMPSTFKYLKENGYSYVILGEAGDALFGEFIIPENKISIFKSGLKTLLTYKKFDYPVFAAHSGVYKLLFSVNRKVATKYHLDFCDKVYKSKLRYPEIEMQIPFLDNKLFGAVSNYLKHGTGRKPMLKLISMVMFKSYGLVFQEKKNNFNGLIKYCYEEK